MLMVRLTIVIFMAGPHQQNHDGEASPSVAGSSAGYMGHAAGDGRDCGEAVGLEVEDAPLHSFKKYFCSCVRTCVMLRVPTCPRRA